jgi:hypothetical protein
MATPTNLPAPAVAGQVLTAAYVNDLAGAFRVLQVVTGSTTTQTAASNTNAFVDTGLTATITPQSATSKILVFVSQNGVIKVNNTSASLRLLRGVSTVLSNFAVTLGRTDSAAVNTVAASTAFLDDPATTSATTYKTQFCSSANVAEVVCQLGSAMSTIVLLEISA